MFRKAATQENHINLEEYTSSVTSHIIKCVDDVVITKKMKSFPNQKAWMNGEVMAVSRAKKAVVRIQGTRAGLKAGIKEAKLRHQKRLERDLNTNNGHDQPLSVSTMDGRRILLRVNVSKAAGLTSLAVC